MSRRKLVLVLGVLLTAPLLAGCASDEPVTPGGTFQGDPVDGEDPPVPPMPPAPKGTSQRWHFHDLWNGRTTLTLFDDQVELGPTFGPDGLPAVGVLVALPHGTLVPPETGTLTFTLTWEGEHAPVNLTFRAADSNDWESAGDLVRDVPLNLSTTESMTDVPHRQESQWRFNFTSRPGGTPPATPPTQAHLLIQATIGRPLFIDPPHLDWWRDAQTIPLVVGAHGAVQTLRADEADLSPLPPEVPRPPQAQSELLEGVRVPVDEGRIVPEGARSLVAWLNWTSEAPAAKLALAYQESNTPSEGLLEVAQDGAASRVFVLLLEPFMTDTTYSNRTTWALRVFPEGSPAAAFKGTFTLDAWVSQREPAEALREILGEA